MMDEIFIFLSQPYEGKAYRKTDSTQKQYCKISEIMTFITDSISNSTLNKGIKYQNNSYVKFKYKFNSGSNKETVSVVINKNDYPLYEKEINTLNQELSQSGYINKWNLPKIKKLLDYPLALLTFTDEIDIK